MNHPSHLKHMKAPLTTRQMLNSWFTYSLLIGYENFFYDSFTWSSSSQWLLFTFHLVMQLTCNCCLLRREATFTLPSRLVQLYSSSSSPSRSFLPPSIDVKQRDPYTWRDNAVVHTVTVHCSCNYQWNEGNMWSLGHCSDLQKREKFLISSLVQLPLQLTQG